jgi:hypothetical protein
MFAKVPKPDFGLVKDRIGNFLQHPELDGTKAFDRGFLGGD